MIEYWKIEDDQEFHMQRYYIHNQVMIPQNQWRLQNRLTYRKLSESIENDEEFHMHWYHDHNQSIVSIDRFQTTMI